jgi:2,3-bisphosphoglycerate-independent phosphoglycerate mutase
LEKVIKKLLELKIGVIGTLGGRYFGMDRDKRWDRTEKAYRVFWGEGARASQCNPQAVLQDSYHKGKDDEFVEPISILPEYAFQDGDECIFLNFRADRMRQIVAAVGSAEFSNFERKHPPLPVTCLTSYDEHFPFPVVYEPNSLSHILGEVVADAGLKQFRIAETEKYPHVTFFFNGGVEVPYPGEHRILIPSPKVATYDLQPEMSAYEVTQACRDYVEKEHPDFVCLNYANSDMVGHT